MFDLISNDDAWAGKTSAPKPTEQKEVVEPSDPLAKLLNEAYRRGYSAGHKDGWDHACKAGAK